MVSYRLWGHLRRSVCWLCVLWLSGLPFAHGQDPTDDVFLQQLVERGLHELAAQHCRDLRDRSLGPEEAAEWQHRLTRVAQHHAWFLDRASRAEFLASSITGTSEFLAHNSPGPIWEMRLRLQQARTMRTSLRITLVTEQAGHLTRLDSPGIATSTTHSGAGTSSSQTRQRSVIKNADDAIALADELLKKIEQGRSLYGPDLRLLRDECRILLAELHLAAFQLQVESAASAKQHAESLQRLTTLVRRSTSNRQLRHEMELITAQWERHAGATVEFDARIRRLQTAERRSANFHVDLVLAEAMLVRQQADEALRILEDIDDANILQRQQQAWLALEAQLVHAEIADELADAEYIATVDAQFRRQLEISRSATRGVYRSAVEAVAERYSLVSSVGVAVANLIERINSVRRYGNDEQALNLAGRAIDRLPDSAAAVSRASLLLYRGEMLIDMQRWSEARQDLETAISIFAESENVTQQAAADLLRVFVLAQLLRQQDETVMPDQYRVALENHIRRFSAQRTADTAREWLLQVLEVEAPADALALLDQMLQQAEDTEARVPLLQRYGRLLTQADSAAPTQTQQDKFREHVAQVIRDSGPADPRLGLVKFYRRWLDFLPGRSLNWEEVLVSLDQTRAEVTAVSGDEQVVADATLDLLIMEALATARSSGDAALLTDLRRRLTSLREREMRRVIHHFYRHYHHEDLLAGDPWLVTVTNDLLGRLIPRCTDANELAKFMNIAATNVTLAGDAKIQQNILNHIMTLNLSDDQMLQVALALSSTSGQSRLTRRSDRESTAVQQEFWQRVSASSRQGSNLWLEASLRLAEFALQRGDRTDAQRRLGVVQTLYPDWGTRDRKERARILLDRLK